MKYAKSVVVLTCICLGASLLLSYVNAITEDAIAANENKDSLRSVEKVLPEHDNDLVADALMFGDVKVYRGFKGGEFTGAAIESLTRNGYGGSIKIMTGLDPEGKITAFEVVTHAETPGLGSKVFEDTWKAQLAGKSLDSGAWEVKKDNPEGVVDEVTGATITSRAVTDAVSIALETFDKHRDEIMEGGK